MSINYRTPHEIMAEAEPVIRAALPDANVPTSIRRTGVPVRHRSIGELGQVLDSWVAEHSALSEHAEGIACVVSTVEPRDFTVRATSRIRWLTPQLAKGLEFDLVVLIDPDSFGAGT